VFSTTELPQSLVTAIDNGPIDIQGTRVQLNPSELLALKQSFLQVSTLYKKYFVSLLLLCRVNKLECLSLPSLIFVGEPPLLWSY